MVLYRYTSYGEVEAYINPSLTTSEQTIANILMNNNGFVYKGYYYDVETGWFWLSSRYYSPELCRFISPDDIEYLDKDIINGLEINCGSINLMNNKSLANSKNKNVYLFLRNLIKKQILSIRKCVNTEYLKMREVFFKIILKVSYELKIHEAYNWLVKKENQIKEEVGNNDNSQEFIGSAIEEDTITGMAGFIDKVSSGGIDFSPKPTDPFNHGSISSINNGGAMGGTFSYKSDDLVDILLESLIW